MSEKSVNEKKDSDQAFPGKIAVITTFLGINDDDYHCADRLVAKYGADKIMHVTWPEDFLTEQEEMMDIAEKLAGDQDIKILIINQAVEGTDAAVDKFKETRKDVFIIYCNTNERPLDAVTRANLIISINRMSIGAAMVKQASKQGAKVFVHYSILRHMEIPYLYICRDRIRETCMTVGLQFLDITVPDPVGEAGLGAAQKFILGDVPKLVARYGENTAFYSTTCSLQAPLIKAVVNSHAIFPQPCCPSPYHGFPEALGIKMGEGQADLNYVISEACRIAAEKNMTDRLSTWPVASGMMFANAGAEYAIKWIKGEVPKAGIDRLVLEECMNNFIEEVVGEASNIYMTSYSSGEKVFDNYKLILMSYLDF